MGLPPDVRLGVLQRRVAAGAGPDEEVPELAAQAPGVGDDGGEVHVVGQAVERPAERNERARVLRHRRVLGVVEDRARVRELAPHVEEREELDRRALADGPDHHGPLGAGVEAGAVAHDVGDELPGAGTGERLLLRPGVEVVQELGAHPDEEQHLGGDAVPGPPGAPVGGVHAHFQMHEARGERGRHPVHDAPVPFAVPAGDEGRAFGEHVLAAAPVEHELVEGGLDHRDRGGQLFEVHEPAPLGIARGQERRGRPAGTAVHIAPRNAAQVHGVEQQGAHVEVGAVRGRRDLLGNLGLRAPGRPPDDDRLAGLDEPREGVGERARAQRVVGGDGRGGTGHGKGSPIGGWTGKRARTPRAGVRRPPARRTANVEGGFSSGGSRNQERAGDAWRSRTRSAPVSKGSSRRRSNRPSGSSA